MVKKILVVDDEPHIAKPLADCLQANGFTVSVACDGTQGLAKAREEMPDLIITDVMMPNMDGPSMAEILKNESTTSSIPVIFLTALVMKEKEEDQQNVIEGNYSMAKPFNPEELLIMINKVLSGNG